MKYTVLSSLILSLSLLTACSSAPPLTPVLTSNVEKNAPTQQQKHYVILVSLDGFRYDYASKYDAKNIQGLGQDGVAATEGMLPAYPSKTFPNHLTLVTGLLPEHHGIVANSFYDAGKDKVYRLNDPTQTSDGSWYGGTPLWSLAEQQGMRTACFFWPGSEASIQDARPTYYLRYDDKIPNEKRVQQVLQWLQLPDDRRPHFITLYFADADEAGHKFGPDSQEVEKAVHELDQRIGELREGVKKLNLPVDIIVLADHGMVKLDPNWIYLDKYLKDLNPMPRTQGIAFYPKDEKEAKKIYKLLYKKDKRFSVYRRKDMPAKLKFSENSREGDPVIVINGPYEVRLHQDGKKVDGKNNEMGNHGFDPAVVPEMKASFFAAGPDIKPGTTVPVFANTEVYPFVAKILELDISQIKTMPIDGKLDVLNGALR